ncbi:serine aminopeptidase, S33 [Nitzschia inconspicua]|uniref:Serine aminopeptidase, S33 n=1 Tax=Nitzschia inconspicua TaxID=303405 RepID=A0A9K3LEK6_9STRA|nr:serine aminopeptidase, S33 [Nitzschia inconspicua]
MGNELSQEEQDQILEEAYNLEDQQADLRLNSGTAAPNCQPKHTQKEQMRRDKLREMDEGKDTLDDSGGGKLPNSVHKHRRASSTLSDREEQEERRKRQHHSNKNNNEPEMSAAEQQKKLSYFQMARLGYQELVNAIIRPPRADYKMEALGPPAFTFCGKRFTRTDFTLRTKRGFNLECSHWEPVERTADRIPVVIYMHGNSSARVEVLPQLSYLLSLGVAVFSFDFAGSGKSDGEYVSLGYYEREDLACVVAHLRATNVVSTIALWGRSMGAATSLMFGDRDPSIACMILDSPFADLTQLAEEMVEKGRDQGIVVPTFVVSVALRMISGSVKKQANVNIKNISPISHADKCFIPALFVAGEHDDFIKKHHAEAIYERYAGDKNIIIVEGDHNSPRPKFMFDSASIFLQTCLQIPNSWALPVPPSMNLMCPPWYFEMYHNRSLRSPQQNGRKPGMQATNGGRGKAGKETNGKSGFEGDQMGMTQERQREIQASLFKMLGQADDPVSEPATKDEAPSRGSKQANSVPPPQHQKPSSKGPVEVITAIPSDEAG